MKKKITNSQELNNYYNMVNTKLKKYSEMNIQPQNVVKYLKPGSENFFKFINEDDDLKDVDGIEVVLKDIIEDTYAAFKDGLFKKIKQASVKTFEGYIFESVFDDEEISDDEMHKHERALADIYKVSISYIDCINKKLHLYDVKDDGTIHKVMVYTPEQLKKDKDIISKFLYKLYSSKLNQIELPFGKTVKSDEILDMKVVEEEFLKWIDKNLTDEEVINTIANRASINLQVKFTNKKELNDKLYYLFEVR